MNINGNLKHIILLKMQQKDPKMIYTIRTYQEAILNPKWKEVMSDEFNALISNDT